MNLLKRLILLSVFALVTLVVLGLTECTENARARNFGGTTETPTK